MPPILLSFKHGDSKLIPMLHRLLTPHLKDCNMGGITVVDIKGMVGVHRLSTAQALLAASN